MTAVELKTLLESVDDATEVVIVGQLLYRYEIDEAYRDRDRNKIILTTGAQK